MLKLLILVLILAGVAAAMAGPSEPATQPAGPHPQVAELVQSKSNLLKAFTPRLATRDDGSNRHVPMVDVSEPWTAGKNIPVEVPECIHGRTKDDRRAGFLFWGRSLTNIPGRKVRYASKEKPEWKPRPDGGITLDNPLEGGLIVHFRVVPHDRMVDIQFGLTNDTDKDIHDCWAQVCSKSYEEPSLAERHPGSSWMVSDGKLISWDAGGQDLTWLEKERKPRATEQFKRSCFFIAEVGRGETAGKFNPDHPLLTLARFIDNPAIAKADKDKKRAVIVYSPSGARAFYNVLQPCFHSDPHLNVVPAHSTKFVHNYVIFFEGDLEKFMNAITEVHKKLPAAKAVARAGQADAATRPQTPPAGNGQD